jgi:branched-chain amino acid transport system permease protein
MVVLVFLFAWLSLRLEEDGFGVMSIAVHLAFLAVILNWQTVTRGALGIPRIPRSPLPASIEGFAILILLVSLIWIAIIWWLDHGRFGRALGALSSHPWHARSLGINRRKMHVLAFFIAGFGGLLSAIFFPPYIFLLSPTDYQFGAMIFAITIVIAGRPGSVLGVTLATFLITFLHEGLRFAPLAPSILGPVRMLIFGLILFAVVWWRRDTLFPQAREI